MILFLNGSVRHVSCNLRPLQDALDAKEGANPLLSDMLQTCSKVKSLPEGRKFHAHMIKIRINSSTGALLNMYINCGSIVDSHQIFWSMPNLNTFTWTIMIAGCSQLGYNNLAVEFFVSMRQEKVLQLNKVILIRVLTVCANLEALGLGKLVHAQVIQAGLDLDIFVITTLIRMYVTCESMENSLLAFNRVPSPDIVLWNAMISGYLRQGYYAESINLYYEMHQQCLKPNNVTFINALSACSNANALAWGKRIHAHLVEASGAELHVFVATALLDMYAKCGSITEARGVFDRMQTRDIVAWNVIISGYAQNGFGSEALELFDQMHQQFKPNKASYIGALNASESLKCLECCKLIHSQILISETDLCNFSSRLIIAYAKCGSIEDSKRLFDTVPLLDIDSWTAMVISYVEIGNSVEAIDLSKKRQLLDMKPNKVACISVLRACIAIGYLEYGKLIHAHFIIESREGDAAVTGALVGMYARLGSLSEAQEAFDRSDEKDVILWNTLISEYSRYEDGNAGIGLFGAMQHQDFKPNHVTYISVLRSCIYVGASGLGKYIHALIVRTELESDIHVTNTLILMYFTLGNHYMACQVFNRMTMRDLASWTTCICGQLIHANKEHLVKVFKDFQNDGLEPDKIMRVGILNACGAVGALEWGKHVHAQLMQPPIVDLDTTIGNALLGMYIKCGMIEDTCHVFDRIAHDIVSWRTMIMGYEQSGYSFKALQFFKEMENQNFKPDKLIYISVLHACASVGNLHFGEWVHSMMIRDESSDDAVSALVDMYAKCGCIKDACGLFEVTSTDNVALWTVIISAYAEYGNGKKAFDLFCQMQRQGSKPNAITFVSVLAGCTYEGMFDEACHCFDSMSQVYNVAPLAEHYACMADLLGHLGHLYEAKDIIDSLPFQCDIVVWRLFLGACYNNGELKLAESAIEEVVQLDLQDAAVYILMSNMYAVHTSYFNDQEDFSETLDHQQSMNCDVKFQSILGNTI